METQFRDTSSKHSTHEHDTRSTHIEHHHQDNMCITTMTGEQLTNDDVENMGKGKQGGSKAIHARYGNRMQAMTEKELRQLMEENSGKYVVYDGKIMTPGTIKQLKNHTIVRIVDRMMGGGKKKSQKKQNKEETTSSSESDALQDMFMDLMKENDDKGNSVFRTLMQLDDEMTQEALSKKLLPKMVRSLEYRSCHLRRWNNGYAKTEAQLSRRLWHSKRKQYKRRNNENMR